MKANQAAWPVRTICRVLGLSPSGYYAWVCRAPSARARRDAQLLEQIKAIWSANRQVYGRPRIHAELQEAGEPVSAKRVGRLMRRAGIAGASRRRSTKTTRRDERAARVAPDLVDRDFSATAADQLWVADITYVATWPGFVYLAVVLDAWSRRVVGWSMAAHLRTELVLDALNMATWQRRASCARRSKSEPKRRSVFDPPKQFRRNVAEAAEKGEGVAGEGAEAPVDMWITCHRPAWWGGWDRDSAPLDN